MKLLAQPLLLLVFAIGSYLIMFRYHNEFSLLLFVLFGVVVSAVAVKMHKGSLGSD